MYDVQYLIRFFQKIQKFGVRKLCTVFHRISLKCISPYEQTIWRTWRAKPVNCFKILFLDMLHKSVRYLELFSNPLKKIERSHRNNQRKYLGFPPFLYLDDGTMPPIYFGTFLCGCLFRALYLECFSNCSSLIQDGKELLAGSHKEVKSIGYPVDFQ